MRVPIVLCLAGLLLAGCSQSKLLTRQDYAASQYDFIHGNPAQALETFPRRAEQGTFITAMERGYLSLIQGKPEMAELQRQAQLEENQVRYHNARDGRSFFYVETPEHYYPAEHEIIWLHFLLSWGYAEQEQWEQACAEARTAGSLLPQPPGGAGQFDDPVLRLMLAALWARCGNWPEAQANLRAAWALDNSLLWASELAQRETAPAHLFVVLGGPGPEVEMDANTAADPLLSPPRIRFQLRGSGAAFAMADQRGKPIGTHLSPDAGKWYQRRLAREDAVPEAAPQEGDYRGRAAGDSVLAGGKIAGSAALGVGIAVLGVGAGVALAVNSIKGAATLDAMFQGAAEGAALGGAGVYSGMQVAQHGYARSTRQLDRELDPSPYYRYVRYLPEYLWMGWSDRPVAYPVELTRATTLVVIRPAAPGGHDVHFAYMPEPPAPVQHPGDQAPTSVVIIPRGGDGATAEAPTLRR